MGISRNAIALAAAALIILATANTRAAEPIKLPDPTTSGGKPLLQTLSERKSTRSFSTKPLPRRVLSDLLWAAFGINRPESGKRTAPSAHNWQEIDIYVATADGLYRYDAQNNALQPVLNKDVRAMTGKQAFVKTAPVNLVYVADYDRMESASPTERLLYSAVSTGAIVQNVYLFCASQGLATVVRGSVDRPPLAEAMGLNTHQHIIVAQTVGYVGGE